MQIETKDKISKWLDLDYEKAVKNLKRKGQIVVLNKNQVAASLRDAWGVFSGVCSYIGREALR